MWEKEKLLVQVISPFPTIFSKGFFPRPFKGCHCVGMVFQAQEIPMAQLLPVHQSCSGAHFSKPCMFDICLHKIND